MTGAVYQGRPAIQAAVTTLLAPLKSVSATIREHNIVTDGDFACDMLTTDFSFEDKSGTPNGL